MRTRSLASITWLAGAAFVVAVALAHAQDRGAPADAAVSAGAPEHGGQVYTRVGCYLCHGHRGQGGAGRKLAPSPLPYAVFAQYVRHPAGDMPAYSDRILSDADLGDIHAFLQGIPAGRAARDIPLLDSIALPAGGAAESRASSGADRASDTPGRTLFLRNCAACHQDDGRGTAGVAPPLAGSSVVNGDAALLSRLVLDGGFKNPAMPRFATILADEQAAAVLSYIRTSWGNDAGPVSAADLRSRGGGAPLPAGEVSGPASGGDHHHP